MRLIKQINPKWAELEEATCKQTYHLIKPSHYHQHIIKLTENTQRTLFATYWHEQHNYTHPEIVNISQQYLATQARIIKKKWVIIQRVFVSKQEEPDAILAERMRLEAEAGIQVFYLMATDWKHSSYGMTEAEDFAIFDENIALLLGKHDSYSLIQRASVTMDAHKVASLIDLFKLNLNLATRL